MYLKSYCPVRVHVNIFMKVSVIHGPPDAESYQFGIQLAGSEEDDQLHCVP